MEIGGSPSQNSAAFSRTFLIGLENGGSAPPTMALRIGLHNLPTAPKDHSAQNNLSTPNTIYMPKAAAVSRFYAAVLHWDRNYGTGR